MADVKGAEAVTDVEGARAVWRRPSVLAAATVLLVCVPRERDDLTTASDVTPADVASVALVVTAAAALLASGRTLPGRAWITAPLVVGVTAATVASQDIVASLPGLARYLQVFVLVPLAVVAVLRDRVDLWLVGGAVCGTALIQGAVGSWQALTGNGASYAGESIRAVGTFGATGVMGMATVVGHGLIVALALGLALRGRRRAAALAGAALLAPPLVFSLSRGAWLAVGCAAAVMLVTYGLRTAARTGLFAAAACVLLVGAPALGLAGDGGPGPDTLGHRLTSIGSSVTEPDRSVSDRYGLWETAAGIWRDDPVTGAGPRSFPALRDSRAPLHLSSGSDTADPASGFQRQPLLSPHNMYLLVLSEQGLVGATAFCLFLGCVTVWCVRRARRTRSPWDRAAGLAASGFLAWQLVDFLYSDIGGPPTLVTSVMLGTALWWAAS
ncbi:O-antigen ligase family protein [Planobispora longispora]|uniref:O-antigen ligase family protein n=1 Tax=Planobispora longispora TaxID=28887 RepID=UPI0019414C1F|nr:O-antigen ligase family protein [Planobispora longispora]